ncbi:uncharacterized protein B0H64DRAFT_433567 [Chaetomium fimeti]|uniref:Uncharacterized protein n=1 Tax=Chaetomium fimeti TaxID=1854472 RepID=A0AAE0LR35_9PEZI|nr:hypothetical protein B0H64DRAFT_433567 [Chaetomium fimeti]
MTNRFQPYQSEIDHGQFIVQPITILRTPSRLMTASPRPTETAQFAAALSRAICTHVETAQRKIGRRTHGAGLDYMEKSELLPLLKDIGPGAGDWETIEDQRFLVLQPLFRAVAIVLHARDYDVFIQDISQIPVLLVLTGNVEGLSAPIAFDHIADQVVVHHDHAADSVQVAETRLSTAVGFLMHLEQRELAAFRPNPDPCAGAGRLSAVETAGQVFGRASRIVYRREGGSHSSALGSEN